MNHTPRAARNTRWQRLRPFLRLDLRGRLVSAAVAVAILFGLSWLAISGFTGMDSYGAHALRVELGIESANALCGGDGQPLCSYDDREQELVDEAFGRDRRVRMAILHELDLRLADSLDRLDRAEAMIEGGGVDFSTALYDLPDELEALLVEPDLRPLDSIDSDLVHAAQYDPMVDVTLLATKARMLALIDARRGVLKDDVRRVARERAREHDSEPLELVVERGVTLRELQAAPDFQARDVAYQWFLDGQAADVSRAAVAASREQAADFATALRPEATIWEGGWGYRSAAMHDKTSVRYRSMVGPEVFRSLLGALLLGLAAFMLTVVAPVASAIATAREREAGTLPVLRMTGLSAGDLSIAMIFGPNVFAYATGAALLLLALPTLAGVAGVGALALPLVLLLVLSATTSLTAIGLGDALGQRVNAMVVGGGLALLLVVPGLLGTALASLDVASTGLLLGPVPAVMSSSLALAGVPGLGLSTDADLATTMIGYGVFVQVLLAMLCLHSWRRRVEQGWAPLFRPLEGIALAVASIGCSALSLLDISARANAQDFNALNLLTALSSSFLLPILGWLLISSLRRPARARAIADHVEARRAFLRFQGFIAVTLTFIGSAYWVIMDNSGLARGDSEVMWATLAQVILVAETAIATLLWVSRRRDAKLRAGFIGGALVLVQVAMTIVVYALEAGHVARTNEAALPLLLGSEVSAYWIVCLVVLWAAGIALLAISLMRGRGKGAPAEETAAEDEPLRAEEPDASPRRRVMH